MIDALFGSKTRVKLLHLFMNHPGEAFYVREITRLIEEQINSVRRELSNMMGVGVITSDSADNKLYYKVNEDYEFYTALRAIFANEPIAVTTSAAPAATDDAAVVGRFESILETVPALRLAVVAGSLVRGSSSPVDLLIVGNVSAAKVAAAVKAIERQEKQELNYTVLPYDEFYYRLSVRDKFLTQILTAKHSIVIDKDNVLRQK